jgi:cytochrome c biogenesis protein CcmG, thiol:disulfide interchange protein DsbE
MSDRLDDPPLPADGASDAGALDAPRRRIAPLGALAAAVAVAALVVVLVLSLGGGGEQYAASPIVGRDAPDIAGETFDGDTVDVTSYRGRWLVVNFFATWCIPCVEEHPELVEFDERHSSAGDAAVVSVVVDTPADEARAFFDRRGGDWPVVLDPESRTSLDYGMLKVPETFLVRPDGIVAQRILGGVRADDLDRLIEAHEAASAS